MPIYEYQCKKCGEIFEVFQKLSDPPPKKHSCGGRKIERVMSRTSFQLKGTGWYITDYGKGKGGGGGGDGGSNSGKPGPDKSSSTDKTPAKASASS